MAKISGAQAIAEAIAIEMRRNSKVILEGIDVTELGGAFGQYQGLYAEFGADRVFDAPISEASYTGAGVGLAMSGFPTIVEIEQGDFTSVAFDAIVNQAAKMRYLNDGRVTVPLTVIAAHGARTLFGAQHSQSVESWYTNAAGLKIVVPTSAADMKGLMAASIRDPDPVLYLPYKAGMFMPDEVPEGEYVVPIGKGNVVKEGKDLTIIAWQGGLFCAQMALAELAKEGIDAELIDLRSIVPYDKDLIAQSVSKTGRAMIIHEAPLRGGFGGEIAAYIADACYDKLKAPVKRLGGANIPFSFGGIEEAFYPQIPDIVKTAVSMVKG